MSVAMKLVTFVDKNGQTRVGLRVTDSNHSNQAHLKAAGLILDLGQAAQAMGLSFSEKESTDMLEFIRNQKETLPKAHQLEKAFQDKKIPPTVLTPEPMTKLLSPVPRPTSMRDGYAFRQHVEAARRNRGVPMIPEFDLFPVFYFTNHLAVTGPGPIQVHSKALEKLDFELEVAIVVGKEGRNLKAAQADEYIFGYMIMNDWSARALQMEEMKLNLGPAKGKDFATSLGPYLVPREDLKSKAIPSPQGERHDLAMKAFVGDKQVSSGNLKDMTWTFAQILEYVSMGVTIYPGDVIGSGTVGTGCFLELNGSKITDNWWLKPGDHVVMEVDEMGRLENTIEAEK